jgi:hypothetical protein
MENKRWYWRDRAGALCATLRLLVCSPASVAAQPTPRPQQVVAPVRAAGAQYRRPCEGGVMVAEAVVP